MRRNLGSPCKDCQDRHSRCHITCTKGYREWAEARKQANAEKLKETFFKEYLNQRKTRIMREQKRKQEFRRKFK